MHHYNVLMTCQVPCELSWQLTKHGVCDYHCKNRSSKASPVSAKKTHKRFDTIREKLIIKSQVELVIVQNLQRENCDKNLSAQTEISSKTRFEGKWKKISPPTPYAIRLVFHKIWHIFFTISLYRKSLNFITFIHNIPRYSFNFH